MFGKGNKNEEEKDIVNSHFKEGVVKQQQQQQQRIQAASVQENPQENRKRQKDLERLLMKADKDKISEYFLDK